MMARSRSARRVLPVALVALLLVPGASAAPPTPEFPEELVALLPGWVADVEALGANDTQKTWYPEAERFLSGAKASASKGLVRSAIFDLETYAELVLAGQINDTAQSFSSDAERKSYAIQRTNEWRVEAAAAWRAYRERLHALEPDIHSLQAMELAMYSADNALNAALGMSAHDPLAREFLRAATFDRGYLLGLIRADHTALLNLGWSNDILDAVGKREGLPPRLIAANWTAMTNASVNSGYEGRVPAHVEELEKIAKDIRANNETTLAVVIALAEERASRATNILVIFGDARTRGMDVVTDADRGMLKQLNNLSMSQPRGYGLMGVFMADAIDRAVFTQGFFERGQADLGTIVSAWSSLDHQSYVTTTLAAASPVTPPPIVVETKGTPLAWTVAALGIVVAALAMRKRAS